MQRCIFNDIVEGKVPAYKVYEDDQFLAFLDVFPRVKGHTLVIPKTQYRWTYDVPNFGEYWEVALKVTKAIQKSLEPQWVNYFTYGTIPYAHIHILPRYTDIDTTKEHVAPEVIQMSKEELAEIAQKIAAAM